MAFPWPVKQQGATGEDVKSIQYLLTAHGNPVTVDGNFGSQTKTAVEHFQAAHGLTADGIVGPQTWPQLIIQVSAGSHGDAVRAVQSQFHSRGDGAAVTVDGTFGPVTTEAVNGFQGLLGITVDGIVGPNTWAALVDRYFAAPSPEQAAQAMFNAWEHNDHATARKNGTPAAVTDLFAQTFSSSAGWTFENCQGAAGHTFCSWRRSNGHELRIGVENAVVAPVFAADEIQFT